jgi:hypothetical protein
MIHTYTIQSDEISDIKSALRGPEYISCINALFAEFRRRAKYNEIKETTWTEAYELLLEIINDYAIRAVEE